MMWRFADKGGRDVCLVPEITGLLQETWRQDWSRRMRARGVFYEARCFRYERPQAGRYREFTQFGIELLGSADAVLAKALLRDCLDALGVDYAFQDSVRRGMSYYVAEGFEATVASLGAQKQVAGGGAYAEGVGWAVGVDRLMLAMGAGPGGR